MNATKLALCRRHWQNLDQHCKARETARHLIAAVEIGEFLLGKLNMIDIRMQSMLLADHAEDDEPEDETPPAKTR